MPEELKGKKIAFLAAEGVEQVELTEPWKAVEQAGGKPELISVEDGEVQAFNHLDKGDTFPVDKTAKDADASDYDGLVLPGGVANPDLLTTGADAAAFVRDPAACRRGSPPHWFEFRRRWRTGFQPDRGTLRRPTTMDAAMDTLEATSSGAPPKRSAPAREEKPVAMTAGVPARSEDGP